MKRLNIFITLVSALTLPGTGFGAPTMIPYEEGIEGAEVVGLTVNDAGRGVATISRCNGCESLRLSVTPESEVIMAGQSSGITPTINLAGMLVDVFYVIADGRLTRIRVY